MFFIYIKKHSKKILVNGTINKWKVGTFYSFWKHRVLSTFCFYIRCRDHFTYNTRTNHSEDVWKLHKNLLLSRMSLPHCSMEKRSNKQFSGKKTQFHLTKVEPSFSYYLIGYFTFFNRIEKPWDLSLFRVSIILLF